MGGGRGWAIWRALQAIQGGFQEMNPPKHGDNCSICRGSLQVSLPTEREGFVRPASQSSSTIKGVLIHILGNAITGGPGTQAGIQGWRTSAMGPMHINEGCHVKCVGDINFVRVRGRVSQTVEGGERDAVFTCAMLVFVPSSSMCIWARRA
jgi:hypothetical protein